MSCSRCFGSQVYARVLDDAGRHSTANLTCSCVNDFDRENEQNVRFILFDGTSGIHHGGGK